MQLRRELPMTHPTDVDVLIVGAGPTGLTMACLLVQFGVTFRIIEKKITITEHSKALAVQARTLELFEQLDLTEKALAEGHPAEGLDLVAEGKLRASIDLRKYGRGMTKYPYVLILAQDKTEKILVDKLENFGKKIEWQRELVELTQHPDYVEAFVAGREKIETIRARYLVAADGARSAVRTFLHLPFEGGTYDSRFLLADIQVQGPLSRRHISLCLSKRGFAGFFPMYGVDRFRAIGLLPDDLPKAAEDNFEVIAEEIRKQSELPIEVSDPRWFSAYRLHHRCVKRFKEQRCFFAGDAAHIHSPAGGQGMNTGIQDAFNLAWKLSYVLSGKAQPKILETYHEERYPIARKLIHSTDQVFSFATNHRPFVRWYLLNLMPPILGLLSKSDFFRTKFFRLVSQIGIHYRESSLVQQGFPARGCLRAGDRFYQPGAQDGLFQAFLVGGQEAQKHTMDVLENFFENRIRLYTLDKRPDLHTILQSFGIYKDGLILVRPDGYVCFCSEGLDINQLLKYLNRFYYEKGSQVENRPDRKEVFPFESFF
jgi:2-polyprenyl-6-methoxyphenol hydroxylase-like FAD-dependent oxidoreductase